jgi:2-dehydro-3-deoxygluconokinase
MSKVLCFGELLLRFAPEMQGNWITENSLPVYIGGAELNVANALAKWVTNVGYTTALPDNLITTQIINHLQQNKIDTSNILLQGNRIGIYYLPVGADVKNAGVIYDRDNSSFAQLQPNTIDWDKILEDVSWFHFSAICPAINQAVAAVCEEALIECEKKNITVSLDLNFRAKLWQYGKKPVEIMPKLAKYCNLIMGNIWAAQIMLGIELPENFSEKNKKEDYLFQAKETSKLIMQKFSKCTSVANTFRFGEEDILYYGVLYTNDKLHVSAEYKSNKVLNKVGSGDCFMAALIYGAVNNNPPQNVIDLAAAAAFQKLFIKSDSTDKSISEIINFSKSYE